MKSWMCSLLLGLALLGVARAQVTAAGVWQSSSGIVFTIPASNTDFDIIIKRPNGQKQLGRGSWDRSYPGYRFSYQVQGMEGRATCTFLPEYPNTLRVDSPNGTTYWQRLR